MLGEFTYPEVGATVNCATGLPRGYNVSTSRVRVGAPECFDVRSSTDTALEGTEVVMLAGFGPVRVRATVAYLDAVSRAVDAG